VKLIPISLEPLFYLYCALIYNDNRTIRLPSPQIGVADRIKKILEIKNYKKINMPDHRYQYLLSLLNSPNYRPTQNIKPTHTKIIEYIGALSEIEKLQNLYENEETQVKKHLKLYGTAFDNVTKLMDEAFDFKARFEKVYVTRNFGKSGMLIPLENECYLILGNSSYKPNIRNLIHEILHAQLKEVNLKVTDNVKKLIKELPKEVYDNYGRSYTIIEESLVRALVIYLTSNSMGFEKEEFSDQDTELILPKLYLEKLNSNPKKKLTKRYLENLSL